MAAVPLLQLENLHIVRTGAKEQNFLVRDLSLALGRGESLGLVGESGSGKSLTALALLGLLQSSQLQVQSGRILFQGHNLRDADEKTLADIRGSRMALIVQDALAALNPVRKIGVQLQEVFRYHRTSLSTLSQEQRIAHCLQLAGLPDVARILSSFPHELSGGMRQRVLLAMALLLEPELLIADEPTTALDVTLQARWVEQLNQLRRDKSLALLFISHDMALVMELCERVLVLYRGCLLESGPTIALIADPWHPYTQSMVAALRRRRTTTELKQKAGGNASQTDACPYAESCLKAMPRCYQQRPALIKRGDRQVACHLFEEAGDPC